MHSLSWDNPSNVTRGETESERNTTFFCSLWTGTKVPLFSLLKLLLAVESELQFYGCQTAGLCYRGVAAPEIVRAEVGHCRLPSPSIVAFVVKGEHSWWEIWNKHWELALETHSDNFVFIRFWFEFHSRSDCFHCIFFLSMRNITPKNLILMWYFKYIYIFLSINLPSTSWCQNFEVYCGVLRHMILFLPKYLHLTWLLIFKDSQIYKVTSKTSGKRACCTATNFVNSTS